MSHQLRNFDLSRVQGLSKKAIDLHLSLYKGYVENFNKLIEQMPQSAAAASPLEVDGYARRFAFEYNGVVLHELFFESLAGQRRPLSEDGAFAQALGADFGDFEGWKKSVGTLAKTRGVGWVLTVRNRSSQRLHNCWIDLHQLSVPANSDVLFTLDLWEHAFMLDFTPAQRADYTKTILDNIDWSVIEARCPPIKSVAHA
jgi:Fe-Mn family superoxide dismutase